ncbi:hypothetical protein D3C87_1148320 [compost metagenome]
MIAVHQRCDAQIQVTARRDDGAAASACAVDQFSGANRDAVAVDAAEVVDTPRRDVGEPAVDQARVGQAIGDVDGVVAPGQQLAAGLVVQRCGGDGQVAPGADGGAVVHVAAHGHAQVAAGGDVAGLVERSRVREGQVLRGLQRAQALQRLDDDGEAFARQHLALVVFQDGRLHRGVALGGDFAARVVQFRGGEGQVLARADGSTLVVDTVGHDGGQLAQYALGRRPGGGQRGAVVQAGGVQGQGVVGLDQAAPVIDGARGGDGQVTARQRAGGVADPCRVDLHLACGSDQPRRVVEFTAELERGVAGRGQLAALIAQGGRGDVQAAAMHDGVARADVSG